MMDIIKHHYQYVVCLCKLFVAFVYVQVCKKRLYSKNIWLIQEKHTEARDNGFHLFKYLRKEHPELNVYFSITHDSADHNKVDQYGNVIDADSIKHYIYYLAAKYSISSQAYGACPYPAYWVNQFHFLCRKDQKNIFLQHGIITNKLPTLARDKIGCDLFVCSSERELNYVQKELGYNNNSAQLLGLCRYDNLVRSNAPLKQILIMPTFRKNIAPKDTDKNATDAEIEIFKDSLYYQSYTALLSNEKLLSKAQEYNYRIVFYLHYAFQAYTKLFKSVSSDIIIADRNNYDVQQLLLESSILITDYSSIYFDFAYMKKPEMFFQFDEREFRKSHYAQGYFDYRADGFGPVFTQVDEIADHIIHCIETGCEMEEKYKQRVDAFFAYHDDRNCERNYNAIRRLN